MQKPLAVLNIEDSESDSDLVARLLKKAGYKITFERVETAAQMRAALKKHAWDIIISDHSLPQFDSYTALNLLHEEGLDIPFITVSGTIGEEAVVEMMKAGAHDFLIKNNLTRLIPAVERELEYAKIRRERKQADDTLRASEKRFRALIENSLDDISLLTADGTLIWESPSVIRNLEYTPNEFVGRNIFELMHPDDLEPIQNLFVKLVQKPASRQTGSFRLRRSDGTWRWVEAIATNLLNEPSVQAIVINYRDITERVQADTSLRESEENYNQLMNFSLEPIYIFDPQTMKILNTNPAFDKLLGYTSSETKKLTDYDVVAHERESADHFTRQIMTSGPTDIGERQWRHKDGSIVFMLVTANKIKMKDADIIFVTGHDITERKQAEEAMFASESSLQGILQSTADGILAVSTENKVLFTNEHFTEMWKIPQKVISKKDDTILLQYVLDQLTNPQDFLNNVQELYKSRRESFDILYFKDGRVFERLSKPIMIGENPTGRVWSFRDITERKHSEDALRESEERFHSLFNRMLDGVYRSKHEGKFVDVNPAMVEMFGYASREEMLAVDIKKELYFEPGERGSHILDTGQEEMEVYRMRRKDGSEIWVEDHGSYVHDEQGRIRYHEGILRDITERKRREREQEALASVTRTLNQGLDLDVLLQNLLDAALHAIPLAEKGAILLLDAENTLKIRALSGYLDPRVRTATFPSTSGYSARAMRESQPLIIADAHAHAPTRYDHEIEEIAAIQSAIVTPLIVKGRAIGVISLDNASRKEAFGEGELTTLSTFASSAALVIQNARLLEETRQRVAELELLYESGLAISQLLSPKEIGQKIIDLLEQKMNWHHTAIRLYNTEDETLELLAFHQPDLKSDVERLAVEARFKSMVSRSGQGLSGWVIQHGETVRSGNLINDDRYAETFPGLHSGLYVPIKSGERIIGVISIESELENAFSKSDEQLTTILATQAASIFENARLYENTIQRAAELEQRVAERTAQIEATKHRLELATYAGQIGVWEYNLRENKAFWDERMHMIHGIPVGGFDGTYQAWQKLIHPDDIEKQQINIQLDVTKNLLSSNEHRILWPDGSVRHIMTSAITAYSPDGTPERIIGINMDITEHKKAEGTQRLANIEMERALRLKNEFLANMSHELRTPLNAILGISESLEEQIAGALNEKQLKYVNIIKESGRHLLELINDILDLSKIEAGRMELDIRKVSVEMLCQSSLRMVKEMAQKKSLKVSFKIKGEVKVILADERRMKQSLVNLFSNAVKFTPDGREIGLEVEGHPQSNEVTFTIWDHGVGIAEENIKRLFKPFVQLDAGLAREYQGTGLGLALVAQMVNLHGGHVKVESKLGQGSRFTITLPWPQNLQTPQAKVTAKLVLPNPRSAEKRSGRILLAEDTDVVVELITEYLRYKGYEVLHAFNGVDAIKLAAQERPDLILMDVMMPIMDGLEATRHIRKDQTLQSTPIIALTALAMSGDSERCLAAGMNDYLSKPIQMQDLADMIEKYIGHAKEESNDQ